MRTEIERSVRWFLGKDCLSLAAEDTTWKTGETVMSLDLVSQAALGDF